jgi:ketosteroid isomerase-like protein
MKIVVAFAIVALAVGFVDASQQVDEDEIRRIRARWDDAWNRHDIKALSALVAEDVRFVNVAGMC